LILDGCDRKYFIDHDHGKLNKWELLGIDPNN